MEEHSDGTRQTGRGTAVHDEDLLLALLNSAPVMDGRITEQLRGHEGEQFAARFGGTGSPSEADHLVRMRQVLHDLIRGVDGATEHLDTLLTTVTRVPRVTASGIDWELQADDDERLAARAALAWSRAAQDAPGRLRACANDECNLFLLDHSRPGTAKWCSMATCGNRMKVRAHAGRQRRSAVAGTREEQ